MDIEKKEKEKTSVCLRERERKCGTMRKERNPYCNTLVLYEINGVDEVNCLSLSL